MRTLVLLVVVVFGVVAVPATAPADTAWVRPVPGPVVRGFEPPRTRYGPGHLGVHFAARPGTPVRAAGPGTVVVAGRIAGALDVVIAHGGGLRTTYAFLASVGVRVGDRVGPGTIVGTTGGRGPGHDGTVLHFGLRVGGTYVDPMTLFAPVDLAARVHLSDTDNSDGSGGGARG